MNNISGEDMVWICMFLCLSILLGTLTKFSMDHDRNNKERALICVKYGGTVFPISENDHICVIRSEDINKLSL